MEQVVDPPNDEQVTDEPVEAQAEATEEGFVSVGKLEYDAIKANAEHLQAIALAEDECNEAESLYLDAKKAADKAKKSFENKVEVMRELIRSGPKKPNPQMLLPGLDGEQAPEEPDDSYLDESIFTVLELTDKQKEKIEGAGIKTVRDFEKLRSGQLIDYPRGLRSIRGVGESTADKWEDDVLAFIKQNTPIQPLKVAEGLDSEWQEQDENWGG